MGQDEETNKTFSAMDELNRIVEAEQRENLEASGGDIILAPAEKQPKDKRIIIIIILAIAIVIVFAIGIISKGGIGGVFGGSNISAEASDFTKWLLNGDGSIATTTEKTGIESKIEDFTNPDEQFIYPLNFYNVTTYASRKDENIENYFIELNNKYNTLKAKTANSNKAADVEKLGKAIELLENNVNYIKIQRDVLNEYNKSEESAKQYLKNRFEKDLGDDKYNTILSTQLNYYLDGVSELILYSSANCYNEKTGGDFECVMNTKNSELIQNVNNTNGTASIRFNYMTSDSMLKMINKEIVTLVKSIGGK